MTRIGIFGLAAMAMLAGCIALPPQDPQPRIPAPSPESVLEAHPPQATLAQPAPAETPQTASPAPVDEPNACHADRYQNLVGQTLANVDRAALPAHRVICFGCMATMDFVATRLTIQLGPGDVVASARCG